jgi:energy-coupling factor transporter ATP-binding protein EcfA2
MPSVMVPQLALERVRKVIQAGAGVCRVRVTVLADISLQLGAGEAVAIVGPLPLARSMLCAIAAGVARPDAGKVRWSSRGLSAVRYAPVGDAPRAMHRRDFGAPGLLVLDAALVPDAPDPDVPALVQLLRPWLSDGGSALVAAPVSVRDWPWTIRELAGGRLRAVPGSADSAQMGWPAGARRVAEHARRSVAPSFPDQ